MPNPNPKRTLCLSNERYRSPKRLPWRVLFLRSRIRVAFFTPGKTSRRNGSLANNEEMGC